MRFHLTLKSANVKTGPIPVSTSNSSTCPKTCGQYETCYAKSGPLAIHWKAVDSGRGTTLASFAGMIKNLPAGQLWRHNQAGDLPGKDGAIDRKALDVIVKANVGRRGFTYTHKPMTGPNAAAVKTANRQGFTVNLSADTLAAADRLKAKNIGPVVVVLPQNVRSNQVTPAGHKIVVCPAVTHKSVSCADCKLCAWSGRQVIIGFPAHGTRAKQVKSDLVQIGAN